MLINNAAKNTAKVLLSGSGSVLGYSAAKLISEYSGVEKLVVTNTSEYFPARNYSSDYIITPDFYFKKNSTEEEFIEFILKYSIKNKINLIIPCSIFELKAYAKNIHLFNEQGILVFVETEDLISAFFDKFETANRLSKICDCSPKTGLIDEVENFVPNMPLPYFIKPRYGYGSNGIKIINTDNDYFAWLKEKKEKYSPYIWQQYLNNPQEEYSCSVLYDENGDVFSTCVIRRTAMNTVTTEAIYDDNCKVIEPLIEEIAKKINGKYCLNFQFRMENEKPFIFEINPRFGAAEAIRASFGQDAYYMLMEKYFNVFKKQTVRYGKVIRAYKEEFIPL